MTNPTDNNIDWPGFLKHMQGMEKRLKNDMGNMEKRLIERMDTHFTAIDKRFNEIEKRLEHLEQDVFILVAHRKANEHRLDMIENVKLPKINKSIRNMQKRFKPDKKQKSRLTVQA